MIPGIPSHGNPEGKVYGLVGDICSANDGKSYLKIAHDALNIGWRDFEYAPAAPTPTPTATPAVTLTPTMPLTATPTVTPTVTQTLTPATTSGTTPTPTATVTATPPVTPSVTQTLTPTVTPTQTQTLTPTPSTTPPPKYTVTLVNGANGASTTFNGQPAGVITNVNPGVYTITATPNAGNSFDKWPDGIGITNVYSESTTINITGDVTITSTFMPYVRGFAGKYYNSTDPNYDASNTDDEANMLYTGVRTVLDTTYYDVQGPVVGVDGTVWLGESESDSFCDKWYGYMRPTETGVHYIKAGSDDGRMIEVWTVDANMNPVTRILLDQIHWYDYFPTMPDDPVPVTLTAYQFYLVIVRHRNLKFLGAQLDVNISTPTIPLHLLNDGHPYVYYSPTLDFPAGVPQPPDLPALRIDYTFGSDGMAVFKYWNTGPSSENREMDVSETGTPFTSGTTVYCSRSQPFGVTSGTAVLSSTPC